MTFVDDVAERLEENIPYELPPELWRLIAQTAATHILKEDLALEIKHTEIMFVKLLSEEGPNVLLVRYIT